MFDDFAVTSVPEVGSSGMVANLLLGGVFRRRRLASPPD